MFQIQRIDSLDVPELQPYRTMAGKWNIGSKASFVAEGDKVVRRLLESHFEVVSVLLPEKWLSRLEDSEAWRVGSGAPGSTAGQPDLIDDVTGRAIQPRSCAHLSSCGDLRSPPNALLLWYD